MVTIDDAAATPLFKQVYGTVRGMILRGQLGAGEKLPSSRAMSRDLGVSRTTVLQAYEELLAEGYIVGVRGSGTFVASELPGIAWGEATARQAPFVPQHPPAPRFSRFADRLSKGANRAQGPGDTAVSYRYDFRFGLPSLSDFPVALWSRIQGRRARAMASRSLGYAATQGQPGLRESIAQYLFRSRGVMCDPDQILMVTGSQQALDLIARVLLDPGDRVVIEDPQYQGAREVFRAAGAELVPIPVDEAGMAVATLSELPAARDAKLAYVTPSHQYPTGSILSLPRRIELLRWAAGANAYVVEDDYDSEFRYGQQSVEAIQSIDRDGRVIYVGTFSKVLFPALRIGYLVLPRPLIDAFAQAKWVTDRHTATFQQDVLSDFIADGHFERHLRRSRTRYAGLRKALLSALEDQFGDRIEVSGTNSGLHVLVWLRDVATDALPDLVARAGERGVGLSTATPYFISAPPGAGLVLGYTHLSAGDIRAGIRALAQAIA